MSMHGRTRLGLVKRKACWTMLEEGKTVQEIHDALGFHKKSIKRWKEELQQIYAQEDEPYEEVKWVNPIRARIL